MKKTLFRTLLILALSQLLAQAAFADGPSPTVLPSPVASSRSFRMTVIPSPVSSGSPLKMAPGEMRQLVTEFTKAQRSEYRAVQHRQELDSKELMASQRARLNEWKSTMNKTREKFFADHPKPDERRNFMKDRDSQYNAFVKMLRDEKTQRDAEAKARLKSLQHEQVDRMKDFKAYLSRGERPPKSVWPSPGQ